MSALLVVAILVATATGVLLLSFLDWRVYPIDDGFSSYRYDLQILAVTLYTVAAAIALSTGIGYVLDMIL